MAQDLRTLTTFTKVGWLLKLCIVLYILPWFVQIMECERGNCTESVLMVLLALTPVPSSHRPTFKVSSWSWNSRKPRKGLDLSCTNIKGNCWLKYLHVLKVSLTKLFSGFVQAMEFWKNYGILKREFHIWKNYGIWAKRPYLWKNYGIFVLVEKSACFLKKIGGKYVRTSTCGFNVCCFSYHFTRPSSTNLPGYSASLGRVNTC